VWQISEGDTKFLRVMTLVPLKDLGSTVHIGHYLLEILFVTPLFTGSTDVIHRDKIMHVSGISATRSSWDNQCTLHQ
jgi:hypothetical protein